jgi:hypothetical protein
MKRILSAAALLGLLFAATVASAQFRDDAFLLTIGYGASRANLDESNDDIKGTAGGFTAEKVLLDGKLNAGLTIYWLSADEAVLLEGDTTTSPFSYSGVPFMLTGRWNFLNSRFAANVGLGVGVHSSTRYLYKGTSNERKSDTSGMAFAIPVELAYFLDPDFYLQFTYSPNWMRTTPLRDDFAHSFALSLGFQWGGED